MVIDFKAEPARSARYSIFDAATGENLDHLHIWYADDERAIYRAYDRDEKGRLVTCRGPDGKVAIAWTEYYLPIEIRPRRIEGVSRTG